MKRFDIISTIGRDYFQSNTETGEFSYPKAFKRENILFAGIHSQSGNTYEKLDIRFADDVRKVAVLVETKTNFDRAANSSEQLAAYMEYEKKLTNYAVIGIIANTDDNRIMVWRDEINDDSFLRECIALQDFKTYANIVRPLVINNKEQVIKNTYQLNIMLHTASIDEKLRSQFVGTCVLALKHNLAYRGMSTAQIISGIREILTTLLDRNLNRVQKLAIIDTKVLNDQDIRTLDNKEFEKILTFIKDNILVYINDLTSKGQDLLNLFFTTFNKYVGKTDKNQAFTPDHIVHFMCQVIGINRNSHVLDPCCGSGAFLVRALTEALNDCQTESEKDEVRNKHIFGIEAEEGAFGLSTTNMLIHGDGNSNVIQGSCFELDDWIKDAHIDRVLMNPPYNAQRKNCERQYVAKWSETQKEDPSKGFHFVYHIAKVVKKGKLAVLLPMQCAIGTGADVKKYKQLMLQEHRLDAVFSLPPDIFHPGASANACCMIFELGVRHDSANIPTFFGYFKDDGFRKKKNLGRVEKTDPITGRGLWKDIEEEWLRLYRNREEKTGLSAVQRVSYKDEWLCEAYMTTDYSKLTVNDFEQTIRDFMAYCISSNSEDIDE